MKKISIKEMIKYKYLLIVATLLVVGVSIIGRDTDKESDKNNISDIEIEEAGIVERIDITHTYVQLEDGDYKIYLGEISLLCMVKEKIHLEYPTNKLYGGDIELGVIEEGYDVSNLSGQILELELKDNSKITIDRQNVSVDKLIEQWAQAREERMEDVINLSDYILEMNVENQTVVEISIDKL